MLHYLVDMSVQKRAGRGAVWSGGGCEENTVIMWLRYLLVCKDVKTSCVGFIPDIVPVCS